MHLALAHVSFIILTTLLLLSMPCKVFDIVPTCSDGTSRQGCCKLVCNCPNALRGQAVLPCGQHPHHKLKQPGGDLKVPVEEDASQEGLEESVNDCT